MAGLWDGVTITHNHDVGSAGSTAISVDPSATNVTTAPNDFAGFGS